MATTELWYQLPPNMEAWNTAVIDNVSRKLPTITDYIAGIEWSKLDPATGAGDGIIQLLNGMCAAPITIRENKMAPIDILVTNYGTESKFYPLSDAFLQKIYATNVIGEPVKEGSQNDEDFIGPSVRIKHIKTVDNVKYASKEAAQRVLGEITKSAKVANWMAENMPEMIVALNEKANEDTTKIAAESIDLPDLMAVWKDGDTYYANGNITSADTVADFCKLANASEEERIGLINGHSVVRDFRQKVAAIHIPTDQEVLTMRVEDENMFGDNNINYERPSDVSITTAYLKDGTSRRGIIFSSRYFRNEPGISRTPEGAAHVFESQPSDPAPQVDEHKSDYTFNNEFPQKELFICEDGYGFNVNIKTDARQAISEKDITAVSQPSDLVIGQTGLFISDNYGVMFGRIEDVQSAGNKKFVTIYDLSNHKNNIVSVKAERGSYVFYSVVDNILPVVTAKERIKLISNTGINGVLSLSNDGRLVLDGISYTVVNCPYALMSKYAASYEDAESIVKTAKENGKCEFEITGYYDLSEKVAVAVEDQEDKTKKKQENNKNTKSGTDDEIEQQQPQNTLAMETPEQAFSVDFSDDSEYGFNTQPSQQRQGAAAGYINPVSTKDLETVTQLNNPKVMDAYIMAGLSHGDLNAQENMLRTNDVLISALEQLSKLLFLARQDVTQYVSESDIQAAIQKLTDVAESLGIQTQSIAQ